MSNKKFGTSRLFNVRAIAKAARPLSLGVECKLKLPLAKGSVKVLFIHFNSRGINEDLLCTRHQAGCQAHEDK